MEYDGDEGCSRRRMCIAGRNVKLWRKRIINTLNCHDKFYARMNFLTKKQVWDDPPPKRRISSLLRFLHFYDEGCFCGGLGSFIFFDAQIFDDEVLSFGSIFAHVVGQDIV